MGIKLPYFASEGEEADWWYDHRHLTEAEFLLAAAAGKLSRGVNRGPGNLRGDRILLPAVEVDPQELAAARKLLDESGIWLEGQSDRLTNDPTKDGELRKAS